MALTAEPERIDDPRTPVRGVAARALERELAEWQCANQEALGDTPTPMDEELLAGR